MTKIGAIALGAVLLLSGTVGFAGQPVRGNNNSEGVTYRDSSPVLYDNPESVNTASMARATTENYTISFSSKSIDSHTLAFRYPTYEFSPAVGSCAAIGGANLIGFFDRYYEELIPNHTAGTPFANTYLYAIEDAAVQAVIRQLYDYMETTSTGTTEENFIKGVTTYCAEKGRSAKFFSCMEGNSFSYATAQNYLKENHPIVLFLNSYNVMNIMEYDTHDDFSVYLSDVPHIMIAFGYKTYIYNGSTTYQYLSVSSGITGRTSGLYRLGYSTKINDALAVSII